MPADTGSFEISRVTGESGVASARTLSDAARLWEIETFPEYHEQISAYYAPHRWQAFQDSIEREFLRPGAGIFLARIDGEPVGVCMYATDGAGHAELRRLFVSDRARGLRLGEALVTTCLNAAHADGAGTARLCTARFLTHAIALYERLGFEPCSAYVETPPETLKVVRYMARPL